MAFGFSSLNIPAIRAELRLLYALPMSGVQLFLENANQLALVSYPDPAAQFVLLRGEERFSAFAKVFWSSETPKRALAIADERPSLAGAFSLLGASFDLPTPEEISILSGLNLHGYRRQRGSTDISPSYELTSTAEMSREKLGEQVERLDGWRTTALKFNPRTSRSLPHVNSSAYFFPWDQLDPRNCLVAQRMNIHVDDVPEIKANARIANRLSNLNIRYLGDILTKTRKQLRDGSNFGKKSLDALEAILEKHNLFLNPYSHRAAAVNDVDFPYSAVSVDWWVEAMKEEHRRRREALGIAELED